MIARYSILLLLCLCCRSTCSEHSLPQCKVLHGAPRRLKTVHVADTRFHYYYNEAGQPDHVISFKCAGGDPITDTEYFYYNKDGQLCASRSKRHWDQFLYSQNGLLTKHVRWYRAGNSDSVMFRYSGNGECFGSWGRLTYCYENGALRRCIDSSRTKIILTEYTYSVRPELAHLSVTAAIPMQALTDFSQSHLWFYGPFELRGISQLGADFASIPLYFVRTYDECGYPTRIKTITQTGVDIGPDVCYTYE